MRGIYFIDPEDKEFKETIKNARKKLETSVAPAMPCKIMKNCGSGGSDKNKTKLACILEADDSTRMRMGNSLPNHHEDHIAGKGDNSLQHYNLVHKFIPMPQAMKIPAAKAAVDKEWEKLEKISAWNLTKVRSKKEVIDEARRVALDWLFDRINLDPKIQIKYIDTKKQLADILTKGSFTRDEWNHLLCLFKISHFSSTVCSETTAKRLQQDSGEERVTAKSRPMMSLIARVPSNVSSSTSVSPGKRSYGNQDPWSRNAEKEERPGRPVVGSDRKTAFDYYYLEQFIESFSSASHSNWDDDHAWSSQEWKTDTEMYERSGRPDETSWGTTRESQPGFSHEETQHDGTAQNVVNEVMPRDRSGRPDVDLQRETKPQQFVIGNDETELELSVESRSFVNRVNDQVRKRQKRISNVTEDGEKQSTIWECS